jgi:hypothetical protein
MDPSTDIQRDHSSLPLRRVLVHLGTVAAIAAIAAIVWDRLPVQVGRRPNVMLLYVGAEDCAPCRVWRDGEGAAFLASAESGRITYRAVKSPRLEDVLKDENWPEDIRGLRNGIDRSDGVPLWLVVSDDVVVERDFGVVAWKQRVLPKIMSYLR